MLRIDAAGRTSQESLWAGEFGSEYSLRNRGTDLVVANEELFRKVLARAEGIHSVLELGCNIGNNLKALRGLLPDAELHGVEINPEAAAEVSAWGGATVEVGSLLDRPVDRSYDLTFTKGVLIHVAPERLLDAYRALTQASRACLHKRCMSGVHCRVHVADEGVYRWAVGSDRGVDAVLGWQAGQAVS